MKNSGIGKGTKTNVAKKVQLKKAASKTKKVNSASAVKSAPNKKKSEKSKVSFDNKALKLARVQIRAINHALRQDVIKVIGKYPGSNVTQLTEKLGLSAPSLSQLLTILRKAHIVVPNKKGREVTYILDPGFPNEFLRPFITIY